MEKKNAIIHSVQIEQVLNSVLSQLRLGKKTVTENGQFGNRIYDNQQKTHANTAYRFKVLNMYFHSFLAFISLSAPNVDLVTVVAIMVLNGTKLQCTHKFLTQNMIRNGMA